MVDTSPAVTERLPDRVEPAVDQPLRPVPLRSSDRRSGPSWIPSRVAAPIGVLVIILVVWTAISRSLEGGRSFLLPPPDEVLTEGLLQPDVVREILEALASTMTVALLGLAISICLGVAAAVVMHQSRWAEHALYPYAVVLQTIPILAVVPLIGFWFGFDFNSRLFVCVLVAIFPIITNTLFGLQSVDHDHRDLFALYAATRRQRLWRLDLPGALPAMITGFKISAGLSVIGSIIADFFFRQGEPGIGRLIDAYRQRLATEKLLTALIFSSLAGLLLFWAFDLIGQRIVQRRTRRRA